MNLLIIFLTAILVLNCVVLGLLVLIQLPKKDAGAGVAFGAGATDALFGAGSGNALTKATKYAGTMFVGLAVVLSVLYSNKATESQRLLEQEIQRQAATTAPVPLPATNQLTTPQTAATNLLVVPETNGSTPAAPTPDTGAATTANPPAEGGVAPQQPAQTTSPQSQQ